MRSDMDNMLILYDALLRAGYRAHIIEASVTTDTPALEVKLGVPCVFPPAAQGDVLIQFTNGTAKVTTDSWKVSDIDAAVAFCDLLNSKMRFTRLYASFEEMVIVADYDLSCTDGYIDAILSYLPRMKDNLRICEAAYNQLTGIA